MLVSICLLFLSAILSQLPIKGSSSQACAACKYQRRKCNKDCPLAPFFPADQPEKFQCAHRLYGVRNIMSILKQVKPESKQDAMTSIIFESAMRARFPVHGCLGIVTQLQNQIVQNLEELQVVRTQIAMCKDQKIRAYDHSYTPHNLELAIAPVADYVNVDVDQQNLFRQCNINIPTNVEVPNIVTNWDIIANGVSDLYIDADQVDKIQNPSFDQQEIDVFQYDDFSCDHTIVDEQKQYCRHGSSAKASLENKIVKKENPSNTDLDAFISSMEPKHAASCFRLTRGHKIGTAA